ncbi:MAG: hypothetical protein ABI867_30680 [Kofleriaceae bacterium]
MDNSPAAASAVPIGTPRKRWARRLGRLAMVLGGLVVGLIVAELVFRSRDDGAFPHVNVYIEDAELGVRLAPGESQKIAFGGNPVTSIRINADGYRGSDLPAPGADEVLVVGDSQVFGLGVEEDETFSAKLAAVLGKPVMNGGVPTYGPSEYRAVIAEQLAKRHPKTVVLTINLVNDLFEVDRPNRERHVVWDGWAVRKETAPDGTTWFPGRDFVYRRSHLFFALRKWWHSGDKLDDRGFTSEGTWQDVVSLGTKVVADRSAQQTKVREHASELAKLQRDLAKTEEGLDTAIVDAGGDERYQRQKTLRTARANPGDIVDEDEFAESSRTIVVTTEQIRRASIERAKLRADLERWAKARHSKQAQDALASLDARGKLIARLTEADAQKLQASLDPPLADHVRDVQKLVEGAGARLVVLILPIDVQVSATEWAKYGATPVDMTPTNALAAELGELGASLGVTVVDARPPLAAAEPGAFLDKDIHMTAKGHAAVATALAAAIAKPAPVRLAASERSPVPVPGVWDQVAEVIVTGSTAAGCETKQVREWLRLICTRTETAGPPTQLEVELDTGKEAMGLVMPHGISILVPVVPGREYAARLTWADRTRVLRVTWPAGADKPTLAFDKHVMIGREAPIDLESLPRLTTQTFASPTEKAICDCWNRVYGGLRQTWEEPSKKGEINDVFECRGAYGARDAACIARYPAGLPPTNPPTHKEKPSDYTDAQRGQCEQQLACIRRDPASPP